MSGSESDKSDKVGWQSHGATVGGEIAWCRTE